MKRKNPLALLATWLALAATPVHSAELSDPSAGSPLPAQGAGGAGTIEGRIKNAISGDYLMNVRIGIRDTNRVFFSDATGHYRILDVPAGRVVLDVAYTGLDTQGIDVVVRPGLTTRQDIELTSRLAYQPGTVHLDAFTVAATREMDADAFAINEQRYAANIKNVIAADAFGDVSEGSLGEFAKRIAGVSISGEAAGDAHTLSLRGFDPEYTNITMDGSTVPGSGASSTSVSRGVTMQQITMNNVSRIEVIKSPLPSMPADFLGGTMNIVSKSAFERSTAQLNMAGTVQFADRDFSLKKQPALGGHRVHTVRPSYDFSYVKPVSENFGFTVSSLLSDQFGSLMGPITMHEWAPAAGASLDSPYFRSFRTTDDSRITTRQSFAGSIDWRPIEPLTLSVGVRHETYDLFSIFSRLALNTGTLPTSYGPGHTEGRSGAGSAAHQQIWVNVFGNTDHFTLKGNYRKGSWKSDFSGSYSNSGNKYRDTDEGFFRAATTTIPSATVSFRGIRRTHAPDTIEVRNAAGAIVDWTRMNNYRLVNVTSAVRDATDEVTSATLNVQRDFYFGRASGALQLGAAYRKREVDRGAYTPTWNFVGADGQAGTADDAAAPFVDRVYTGVDQGFNVPSQIEFPDLIALYALYRTNPEYFRIVEPAAYISQVSNSERIKEEISAAYLQGEIRLLDNRLFIVGGVRFERTANEGLGLLRDRQGHFQRDANGNLIRNAAGNPIPITTNALEVAKLQYLERALKASHAYSDYYPSATATFSIRENLLLRASFAQTMGRPNYANIVPNIDVQEVLTSDGEDGVVVMRNPQLKPWSAKNYEVSLEYYFKTSGMVSVSTFRKDITRAFSAQTFILDDALLQQYELDPIYRGWDLRTTVNAGAAVQITGTEFGYQQRLSFLPSWAAGSSAFANLTLLDYKGERTTFSSLYRKTANWGVRYSRNRFGLGLNWNYRDARATHFLAFAPDGTRTTLPILTLDVNTEFRVTPKISLFFNARNITNEMPRREHLSEFTPEYSRPHHDMDNGIKMSAGIRGRF